MTHLAIRQSGGANIVSIPKAILKILRLRVGSTLDLTIVNHRIILTPVTQKQTLASLLEDSPKENFHLIKEDLEWLEEESSEGEEI